MIHYVIFIPVGSALQDLVSARGQLSNGPVHKLIADRGAFLTPKVSWGSKKHISIKNVQEIENFASAHLNVQTSYDFQTWIFFISVLRATTYLVARGNGEKNCALIRILL